MNGLARDAHDARELANSVSLEDWLRANPDVWELCRAWWPDLIEKLEAER